MLDALAAQRDAPPFTLALLLDNCTDDSAATIDRLAARQPFAVRVHHCDARHAPNAGLARGRAVEMAIAGLADGILLTTDADSAPADDWIAANLAALRHADLIAGRIMRPAGSSPLHDRIVAYYDRLHALRRSIDPVPWEDARSHHWTSGASMAMRIATYRALGGFTPLAQGEDAALADRAGRIGMRVRRDARVMAATSARRDGRAEGGFAAMLAALDRPGAMPLMAHPEDEAWRYRHHAAARTQHAAGSFAGFADAIGVMPDDLARVAAEVPNGEAFAARIVGAPPGGMRTVPLAFAEAALAAIDSPALEGAA